MLFSPSCLMGIAAAATCCRVCNFGRMKRGVVVFVVVVEVAGVVIIMFCFFVVVVESTGLVFIMRTGCTVTLKADTLTGNAVVVAVMGLAAI